MDKRYQVFVSSTYADLKDERQNVIQALMEMDCIPAGMELFPATDDEQWEFIKHVIDDCDYYLLILGGRYGSTTSEGISFTEKEFDYAIEKRLKIIALVHGEPENIPFGKSEQDPLLREKLIQFREKAMTDRLVKFWKTADELPGLVALSLTKTIKRYPAIGWVRANNVASESILSEINDLRKTNAELLEKIAKLQQGIDKKPLINDIADIDSEITIHGEYCIRHPGHSRRDYTFECTISWRKLFSLIAPYLIEQPNDVLVKSRISKTLKEIAKGNDIGESISINDQEFKTITIQFRAYGLVETNFLQTTHRLDLKNSIFQTRHLRSCLS